MPTEYRPVSQVVPRKVPQETFVLSKDAEAASSSSEPSGPEDGSPAGPRSDWGGRGRTGNDTGSAGPPSALSWSFPAATHRGLSSSPGRNLGPVGRAAESSPSRWRPLRGGAGVGQRNTWPSPWLRRGSSLLRTQLPARPEILNRHGRCKPGLGSPAGHELCPSRCQFRGDGTHTSLFSESRLPARHVINATAGALPASPTSHEGPVWVGFSPSFP